MRTSRQGIAAAVVLTLVAAGCNVNERIHLKDGNQFYVAKKYDKAIEQYQKILDKNPNHWEANYLTATAYLAMYHPGSEHPKDKEYAEKGLAAFEKTLSLEAPDNEAREKAEKYYLAFLDSTGNTDKAIAYLEAQLAKRPGEVPLINQIASLYQKKGDFTKALEYFEKRANLNPNDKEAWYTLGVNCWARSYHGGAMVSQEEREQVVDQGIKALDKALAIDPNYFDALSYINLIYREKAKALAAVGKNEEAGQAYAKADEYQKRAIDIRKAQAGKPKTG